MYSTSGHLSSADSAAGQDRCLEAGLGLAYEHAHSLLLEHDLLCLLTAIARLIRKCFTVGVHAYS